ncbi:MAG: hypothetical protein L6R42_004589 [Xanthoria sp. 1 TBL-2021]|nr:MAG: hypothetical protein L6R42_004589 [Xanthoria sp. 1 TBL-2021]
MPTSAGHVNGPISIGLDLDSNATSHLEKAEIVPLESPISNATLGFEKILVVNLPERTDRRDTLTLTAAIGNILLDFLPAVRGESVSPKARADLLTQQSARKLVGFLLDFDEPTDLALETSDFPNDIGNPSKTLPTSDDGITSKKPSLQSPETKSNVSDIDDTSPSFTPASRPRPRAYHHSKKFSPSPPDSDLPNSTPPDRDNPIPPDNTPTLSNHSTADDSQPFLNTPIPTHPLNDKRKRCIAVWPELFGQHRAAGADAKDTDTGNAGKEAGNRETGETARSPRVVWVGWRGRWDDGVMMWIGKRRCNRVKTPIVG